MPQPIDREAGDRASKQHGVVEGTQLELSDGAISWRLQSGRWARKGRQVYIINGAPPSWRQDLQVALAIAGPGSAVSHRAAALIHSLGRFPALVELTTPRRRRFWSLEAVVHTSIRFGEIDITTVGSLPVTTPARTLIDLGAVAPQHRVEEAADVAIREGLTSLPYLRWRLAALRGPGRRGAGVLAAAIEGRGTGPVPESKYERAFMRLLEDSPLPLPELQFQVRSKGEVIARVDASWPDRRLAVEVDSQQWHSTRGQREHDAARDNRLALAGWTVLRFTTDQIWEQPHEVIATLSAALHVL